MRMQSQCDDVFAHRNNFAKHESTVFPSLFGNSETTWLKAGVPH